ncbi:MAG: hypothetical protein ACOC22_03555 [bacterium]
MNVNAFVGIVEQYFNYFDQFQDEMDSWKKDLLKQWEDSKKLPRKKKKQARKHILLEWRIANWEPFFSF